MLPRLPPRGLQAFGAISRTRAALAGLAGACFLGLAYAWGHGSRVAARGSLALLAVLVLSLGARAALQALAQTFVATDWRHADH